MMQVVEDIDAWVAAGGRLPTFLDTTAEVYELGGRMRVRFVCDGVAFRMCQIAASLHECEWDGADGSWIPRYGASAYRMADAVNSPGRMGWHFDDDGGDGWKPPGM